MHGANSTGPKDQRNNTNARSHGAYETLIRERLSSEDRAAFDAVPSDATLHDELRVLRYKMLRLLGDVEQNVVAGFNIERIMADEPTKIAGIVQLAGEIRKMVKDMKDVGGDDPLADLVDMWKAAMEADANSREESGSLSEAE